MQRKQRSLISIFAILLSVFLFSCLLSSCAKRRESDAPLSLAMDVLAYDAEMAMWTKKGESIRFCADDFARAVNLSEIESVTITSLPATADGELRVGATVLTGEQTLSAASLSLMTYAPSSALTSSEFRFKVNSLPYEFTCKLYVLEEENFAPTLSLAPSSALSTITYEDVSYFGELPCYDADGDEVFIEVVRYPEKGILTIDKSNPCSYRYTPYPDASGKDSFLCVARDKYGNYSPAGEVKLEIRESESSARFVDLIDSPYHNAAIAMTEKGVMSGTQVGTSLYFYPELEVSRAEFVVMAMNAVGITKLNPVSSTVFADDADISDELRPYIAAAYDLGYIKGTLVDGKLCFLPDKTVTRAEASLILANMADLPIPTVKPIFSDADSVPAWADASLSSLCSLGVFSQSEKGIEPLAPITRGGAALILSRFTLLDFGD